MLVNTGIENLLELKGNPVVPSIAFDRGQPDFRVGKCANWLSFFGRWRYYRAHTFFIQVAGHMSVLMPDCY